MASVIPLLAAAALVGALHMSAPDHWVTLCILGKKQSWARSKLVGVGVATAGGHVILSVLLGLGIVFLGLVFSPVLSGFITIATGTLMLVVGLGYALRTLFRSTPEDYDREADEELGDAKSSGRGVTYFVVLGGALSPDLSILPVFLLAAPQGLATVVDCVLVFSAVSVASLVVLVLAGSFGVAKTLARAPAKYNDALVGIVIAAVGAYVILFG